MIKFKQKEYSKPWMRRLAKVKKLLNKTDTKIINKSLDIQDKIINKVKPSKFLKPKIRISPKTATQINRETIKTAQNIDKVVSTPVNQGIDMSLKYASQNPIASSGNITSIAVPFISPALAAVPIGSSSIALEAGIKKASPGYSRFTNNLRNKYSSSLLSKKLQKTQLPSLKDLVS